MIQISSREPEEAPGLWEGMKGKRAWVQRGAGSGALGQAWATPFRHFPHLS